MKVKFMNFKEMAITQNAGMCSYLTIAWAVPYWICLNIAKMTIINRIVNSRQGAKFLLLS